MYGIKGRGRQKLLVGLALGAAGAVVLIGCAMPGDYARRPAMIDASQRQGGYGTDANRNYQNPQQGTPDQWEYVEPGYNQQMAPRYPGQQGRYQDPRYEQMTDPRGYNREVINPNYGAAQGDPSYGQAGQELQGNARPPETGGYYDQYTGEFISNRNTQAAMDRQTGVFSQTMNDYRGTSLPAEDQRGITAYPGTGGPPVASIVGVTEIGASGGAAPPPVAFDRVSGRQTMTQAEVERLIQQQAKQNSLSSNMNNQSDLPALNVPMQTGMNAGQLTQPAVSIQTPPIEAESATAQRERWLAEHPEDVNTALALYYHYLAGDDQEKAQQFLPRDFGQANLTLEALEDLRRQISERALLNVSALKICTKVDGFGRYEELPATDLTSGRSRWVEVYCELENYSHKQNAEGTYTSSIHAEITLYDESYRPLVQLAEDVPDKPTFSPRRDFFLVGTMQIPQLSAGRYSIVVKVEDKIANKVSRRKEIIFQVGG